MGETTPYFHIHEKSIQCWTDSAKECYKRHCICEGCQIVPFEFNRICKIKEFVIASYKKFGKPKEEYNNESMQILL